MVASKNDSFDLAAEAICQEIADDGRIDGNNPDNAGLHGPTKWSDTLNRKSYGHPFGQTTRGTF
jgi:hypothetical protein